MLSIEQGILEFISNIYVTMQWPGVVALMAIESACIPLPSEIIMPLAGWMLIEGQNLGEVYILVAGIYGALGCTIGSIVIYVIGRRGGRILLEKYGRYFLVSDRELEQADKWFSKHGSLAIFITRLMPIVRTFISLPAGIAGMDFKRFVIYTFLGSFIWCAGLAYGGYKLGEHWEEIRTAMRPFDAAIIAVIIVLIALYIYRHIKITREVKS